jgi:glycosyltransferase involved in cell wall biosynthesis
MTSAKVTVGMPVLDGGEGFERALNAVRSQTLRDLEIVISDNGSTDGTPEVIEAARRADPRVRVLRQEPPVSGWANFNAVLREATTPYFMWVAADDLARPALLERACALLDERPDVVAATTAVDFVDADDRVRPALGAFELAGTLRENVRAFLAAPVDNSRFYGVYRREALVRAMTEQEYFGVDLAVSLATLQHGGHAFIPDALLVRGDSPPEKYLDLIDRLYGRSPLRYAAYLPFTRHVLLDVRPPLSAGALLYLLRLNLWVHVAYAKRHHPLYGRVVYRAACLAESARQLIAR